MPAASWGWQMSPGSKTKGLKQDLQRVWIPVSLSLTLGPWAIYWTLLCPPFLHPWNGNQTIPSLAGLLTWMRSYIQSTKNSAQSKYSGDVSPSINFMNRVQWNHTNGETKLALWQGRDVHILIKSARNCALFHLLLNCRVCQLMNRPERAQDSHHQNLSLPCQFHIYLVKSGSYFKIFLPV